MTGWWIVLASFLVCVVFSYPLLLLVKRLKSLQVISQHVPESHQQKVGTPNMGGLMVWVALAVSLAGIGIVAGQTPSWLGGMILLFFGMGAIGFVDDYIVPRMRAGSRGLSWRHKLLLQIGVAAGAAWLVGFTAPSSLAVVTFVILFYCNAYNFSDGLDGLAGSLGLTLGLSLTALTWGTSLSVLLASLCAGLVVFLFYNKPKAKVFMGDTGSLPIGALLGMGFCLFISGAGEAATPAYLASVLMSLVMLAELVPVPMQIFWVKVFKKRLFPFTPIHHAFEKAGIPEGRVVLGFLAVQILCVIGALAIAQNSNLIQVSAQNMQKILQ